MAQTVNIGYYSDIRESTVRWLWYPYIPYGKLTLLQGDPGEGKSTFIIRVAAALTTATPLPGDGKSREKSAVIYQCSEDGLADTVKPRLREAGADCSQIAYIVDDGRSLTLDDPRIEQAVIETEAKLLIIDPIQSFIGQDGDLQSAVKMRRMLGRLSDIAEKHGCAVVLVGHMNKSGVGKNLYRGLGSIDIAAIARSVLMISRDREEPWKRYLFQIKNSLAPEGKPISFELGNADGFRWGGECDVELEELLHLNQASPAKKEMALDYLQVLLLNGDMPGKHVFEKMGEIGISHRTVQEAKKELGVVSYKKDNAWYWHYEDAGQ